MRKIYLFFSTFLFCFLLSTNNGKAQDAGLTSVDTLSKEYTITPIGQITAPLPLIGMATNAGSVALTNLTMTVNIYDGLQALQHTFYSDTVPTLAPAGNATLTVTGGWLPSAPDSWTAEYIVTHSVTDISPANDTLWMPIVVSDTIYARDNAVPATATATIGIGPGVYGYIGQQFEVTSASQISSAKAFIGSATAPPAIGDSLAFVLFDMAAGLPNQIIATTDTVIYTTATPGYRQLPFTGGTVNICPGQYVLCVVEFSANCLAGTSDSIYTPMTCWADWPTNPFGQWTNFESFGANYNLQIRLNLAGDPLSSSFSSSATGLAASFSDLSMGAITNWAWDFGDGNTATLQNPMHTYATSGTYTVCLIVTDACGSDTTCMPFTVCQPIAAAFGASVTGSVVTLTDMSTGTPASYLWDFGDGNTSTMASPVYTYADTGTYTICLIVTDACASDTSCSSVTICDPMTTAFGFTQQDSTVTLTDMSTGFPNSWFWDFGDGNTSTMQNPVYTYPDTGMYIICLVTMDPCTADTTCDTVWVTPPVAIGDPFTENLRVYPNPGTGIVYIESPFLSNEALTVQVLDLRGSMIWESRFEGMTLPNNRIRLELSDIADGLYLLRLKVADHDVTKRLMIERGK